MKVEVHVTQRFRVPAPREQAFELLADVPRAYAHFPNMKRVAPIGERSFRLEMDEINVAGLSHQVIYACRYAFDARTGTISWKPVKDIGNGQIEGGWKLEVEGDGTHIEFATTGKLEIEIPLLLRPMATPFVQGMFRSEIGRFLDNVRKALS